MAGENVMGAIIRRGAHVENSGQPLLLSRRIRGFLTLLANDERAASRGGDQISREPKFGLTGRTCVPPILYFCTGSTPAIMLADYGGERKSGKFFSKGLRLGLAQAWRVDLEPIFFQLLWLSRLALTPKPGQPLAAFEIIDCIALRHTQPPQPTRWLTAYLLRSGAPSATRTGPHGRGRIRSW
jgi:hypothetical protein